MDYDDSRALDSLCWQLRQADYYRSANRARIDDLLNGLPPWTAREVQENGIEVNVNELSGTVTAHDGRAQFYNAYLKPGNYFACNTDYGPVDKRSPISKVVTKEINRMMKRSIRYTECFRSKFAMNVAHGITPGGWRDPDDWCPEPLAIGDVLVPGNTYLARMDSIPFVAIYRQLTATDLIKLTRQPRVDPAWNMPLVKSCLKWLDENTINLMSNNWPEIWSPEKQAERIKSDGGFYTGDQVPTIDVWDFYFWNDDDKVSGWNRRMILDAWSQPAIDSAIGDDTGPPARSRRQGGPYEKLFKDKNAFLYNPGKRKWGSCLSEIITWQFADLSAVAPFRYHSVRSLGLLLYAVCHLQNRLYCKFTEAQFEQLMMYFRVKSADDMQRALKVDLVHRGFVDDTIQFIPNNERYQIRADLIQLGLTTNQNIIGRNSASYTSQPGNTQDNRELTATQWMGEANKVTQLVASALNQSYLYQNVEYREIFRRAVRKDSKNPDVLKFQANCLRQKVPPRILYNPECWDLEPERVMGAGNKTLEMQIADRFMAARHLFPPDSQQLILRDWTLALSDDPARAERLVPESPHITDTIHDAQLAAGALMQGMPVSVKGGVNHIEYIETLLASMAVKIQQIEQRDKMGTLEELMGLQNIAQNIGEHIQLLGQDENEQQRVKLYGDQLGKLMNLVKAYAQRLQEKLQKEQAGNGGDPELAAKLESSKILAEAKAANTRESHAQRTAQRQIQFEQKFQQDQAKAAQDLQTEAARSRLDLEHETAASQLDIVAQSRKAQIELQKEIRKLEEQAKKKKKPNP